MLPAAGRARRRALRPPGVRRSPGSCWLSPWVAVGRRLRAPPVPTTVSLRTAGSSSGVRNPARRLGGSPWCYGWPTVASASWSAPCPLFVYGPRNRL